MEQRHPLIIVKFKTKRQIKNQFRAYSLNSLDPFLLKMEITRILIKELIYSILGSNWVQQKILNNNNLSGGIRVYFNNRKEGSKK